MKINILMLCLIESSTQSSHGIQNALPLSYRHTKKAGNYITSWNRKKKIHLIKINKTFLNFYDFGYDKVYSDLNKRKRAIL